MTLFMCYTLQTLAAITAFRIIYDNKVRTHNKLSKLHTLNLFLQVDIQCLLRLLYYLMRLVLCDVRYPYQIRVLVAMSYIYTLVHNYYQILYTHHIYQCLRLIYDQSALLGKCFLSNREFGISVHISVTLSLMMLKRHTILL